MQKIFYPDSIAVIGVSSKPDNLGRNIVANLITYGFEGVVYAVGPSGGMVETHRIYHSLDEIPVSIDLAVILTPARVVPQVLEACGRKGIRWAIIETAGFREYGEQGRQLEEQLVEIADRYGIRFVGPNCIGVMNMENGLCVPFPRLTRFIRPGEVSVISQSGGVGMSALNLMANEGLGLNKFVSVGNMLNLNAEDILEYLIEDEGTALIFLYLETIRDGRRLMEIAKRSPKPILAFKANIGKLGKTIAVSHSASLSSDDKVVEAAFAQAGILRIHDATTLGNSLKILRLPPLRGRNLAVVSRSGGHAVIAADACELSGFELAHLPDEFLREIESHFRASVIRLTNPLDLGDLFDLDVYAQIVEKTLQLDGVDGVIFLQTALSEAENAASRVLLERIMAAVERYRKPVAYYISTEAGEVNDLRQNYDFAIFTQVVETVRALEISHRHYRNLQVRQESDPLEPLDADLGQIRALVDRASGEDRNLLLSEAMQVLELCRIPVVRSGVAASAEEAQEHADRLGYPVAMKVMAEQILHKSDVGGVQLNLRNRAAVQEAYDEMLARLRSAYPDVKIDGVMVQPMVIGGRELILGGRQDPQFGPVVLAGLGGIFVEIIEEVSVRLAPISRRQALRMIESLRGAQILEGTRGEQRWDIEAAGEALLRLSQLLSEVPEIAEIDVNPLRVFPQGSGCLALDARIVLARREQGSEPRPASRSRRKPAKTRGAGS